ncbi:MAG: carbon starvation protein A [Candidatus Omnitrophota bacterium]
MNALVIVFISGVLFFVAFRFYARKLEELWQIDPKRSTPAFTKYDSIDYVPAKKWLVLFGHHFASIAGAGPIVGPVLAAVFWGWGPALIWIILGTIFIGGVHDFGALVVSVREGGASIAQIAESAISRKTKLIFSWFLLLALILVVAVFAYFCAQTFVEEPKIVLPSLGLIPLAVLLGFALYRVKFNSILATIIALVCLFGLIAGGNFLPISLGKHSFAIWLAVLFIYCYFASVAPVNILLQPRDYLSSFLLFFGMLLGYVGLIARPILVEAPFYRQWSSASGSLWPFMFVTVACGAISGFHSLIASGTTSKQIANERHIKSIGYGAMIAEGVLAVFALIAASVVIKGLKDPAATLTEIGPITFFARGYGLITSVFLGGLGSFIAITILNAFILTTLDSATRIARYLSEELFNIRNRFFSSLLVVVASAALAFSGKGAKIWMIFGTANQLVAGLTLMVLVSWLLMRKRRVKVVLIPAVFMLVTTLAALVGQGIKCVREQNIPLLIITGALFVLAVFMISEVLIWRKKLLSKNMAVPQ